MQPPVTSSSALLLLSFALEWTILHEGHEHGASPSGGGGLEWPTVVGAVVFLAVVGAGTWYVYENYGR